MMTAAATHGTTLAVNWPMQWFPTNRTAKRLLAEGAIGAVREVHYYDGNRGPLLHLHDKVEVEASAAPDAGQSWWYRRAQGGGSLLDYLGYGATLAAWFRPADQPTSVVTSTHLWPGREVDEQSVVVATYPSGLSTFQTKWGTFTDPWTHQPNPRCGFVIVGEAGTIASWDYQDHIEVQSAEQPEVHLVPVDTLEPHEQSALAALAAHLRDGRPIDGPLTIECSRFGQVFVDAARRSAELDRRVELAEVEKP